MPSISTSTWSDSVPRMNSEVFLPGPPLLAKDTPGTFFSSSGTELAWLCSICARSNTVTAARLCCAVCAVRVAVTSWSCRRVCSAAWARGMQERVHSSTAAGLAGRELLIAF
ncbi:hypothetical protein D3C72_1674670 [compost metagenome]